MTLDELLQELDSEYVDGLQQLIYVSPPDEGVDTDVDSDKSGVLKKYGSQKLSMVSQGKSVPKPLTDIRIENTNYWLFPNPT